MNDFVEKLGSPLDDAEAETFDLFSQRPSLSDLGMLDARARSLDITIAGRDFEISQAPGILQSNREGGTTGAVIWRTSITLAEWLASQRNVLFQAGVLDQTKSVLELGTGISGVVPCVLSGRVAEVLATDQTYILKTLEENIAANRPAYALATGARREPKLKSPAPRDNIRVIPLDWEEDDASSLLAAHGFQNGIDMVLACDCIFNYALIDPFVQTCEDLCAVRSRCLEEPPTAERSQTLCVIVQQLRQPEVFELWLQRFMERFHVYRLSSDVLPQELSDSSGFAVHVGLLR